VAQQLPLAPLPENGVDRGDSQGSCIAHLRARE
jgi:hypothetical protein